MEGRQEKFDTDILKKYIMDTPVVFIHFPKESLEIWDGYVDEIMRQEELAKWLDFLFAAWEKTEEIYVINPFASETENSYVDAVSDVIAYMMKKTGIQDVEKIKKMPSVKNTTSMMGVMKERRCEEEAILGVAVNGGIVLDYYKEKDDVSLFVTILHELIHMLEDAAVSFYRMKYVGGNIYGALEKRSEEITGKYENLLRIQPKEADVPKELVRLGEYQREDMQTEALACAVEAKGICVLKRYDEERCLGTDYSLEEALKLVKEIFRI